MIRPAYWTDADLHTRLSADVREFYIGYFPWDVDRIGADLYPFRSLSWRRSHIPKWAELLSGHVRLLDCGKHAVVPNLPRYQSPPKPTSQHRKAHDACVRSATPHGATGGHLAPHGTSTGREGKGREVEGRVPADETETSEFRRLVPRPVALGGKAS
jgi:hypothetical protein